MAVDYTSKSPDLLQFDSVGFDSFRTFYLHDILHLCEVHLPGVVLVVHPEGPPQLLVRGPAHKKNSTC
jgi:hypothetical protein